jgi:hypothetical protein
MKSGLPMPILSIREIRLIAPDLVLGGKNSSEKNLSFDSILLKIFSLRVASNEQQPTGDPDLEVVGVVSYDSLFRSIGL